MKIQIAFLVAVLAILLLVSVVLVQAGWAGWYTVEPGTMSGGGYRLDSLAWQVEGAAGGRAYRLSSPARAMLRGSGCCCTYLPTLWCNR